MPLDVVTLMVLVPSLKAIATKSTKPNKWNTVSLNFSLQNIKKSNKQTALFDNSVWSLSVEFVMTFS